MDLGKHIHTLLKRQAAIHVAGLGSFKRIYSPATFDEAQNVFLPPISYIEFDSSTDEGYDFVTYLQQADQVSRSEAEHWLAEEVAAIRGALDASGEVNLEGLGQLVSYGSAAVFKPFDLSGFNFEPVEGTLPHPEEPEATEEPPEVVDEMEPSVLPPLMVEEDASQDPVVDDEEGVSEELVVEEESAAKKSSMYVLIAALAIFVLGAVYYFTQFHDRPRESSTTSDTTSSSVVAAVPSDTVQGVRDTSRTLLSDTTTNVSEQVTQPLPVDENKKFTIVIGTHRTLAKAYEEAEAFNKDGHKTVRVVTPNLAKNLKRVIWDSYATKVERDSALQYVRKHVKTDAWPDVLK